MNTEPSSWKLPFFSKKPITSNVLPSNLVSGIGTLITIFKAVGIIFIIYLVFMIVMGILNIIEKRRIKEMHEKIFEIDKKLNKVLELKKKKK